jgi:hypothetical protein
MPFQHRLAGDVPSAARPAVALAQLADLQPDQAIGYMQSRAGRLPQPTDLQAVVNEVVRHSRKIVAYNQYQPRRHVAGRSWQLAGPDSEAAR